MSPIRMHPRGMPASKAHNEIDAFVSEIIKKYDLTYGELMSCLNQIQASWIKYMIRDERHPDDPEKRGGEE